MSFAKLLIQNERLNHCMFKSRLTARKNVGDAVAAVAQERVAQAVQEMGDYYLDYTLLLKDLADKGWKRVPCSSCGCLQDIDVDKLPEYCFADANITGAELQQGVNCFTSRWALWKSMRGAEHVDEIPYKMLNLKAEASAGMRFRAGRTTYKSEADIAKAENEVDKVLSHHELVVWQMLQSELLLDVRDETKQPHFGRTRNTPSSSSSSRSSSAQTTTSSDVMSTAAASEVAAEAKPIAGSIVVVATPQVGSRSRASERLKHLKEMGANTNVEQSSEAQGGIASRRQERLNNMKTVSHELHRYQDSHEPTYGDEYPDAEEYNRTHEPLTRLVPDLSTKAYVQPQQDDSIPALNSSSRSEGTVSTGMDRNVVRIPGVKPGGRRVSAFSGIRQVKPNDAIAHMQYEKNSDISLSDLEMREMSFSTAPVPEGADETEERNSVFGERNPLHTAGP